MGNEKKEKALNPPDLIMEGSPLVPGLVSTGTSTTLYKVKEKLQLGSNYVVKQMVPGGKAPIEEDALVFEGKWKSKFFGHGSIHVSDPSTGKEFFKIRRSRHAWNPVEWVGRFSYRILPPGSKSNKDALFTVNMDKFGRGLAWQKEEWRIYRGTQSLGELAYYCVGSYLGWDMKCYESVQDYETGRDGLTVWGPPDVAQLDKIEPVAELSQKMTAATLIGSLGSLVLPDALYVKMQPKADGALFLAFAAIIDMAHDITGKGNVVSVHPNTVVLPSSPI